jgi:L-iditol 2-dehydrogenase
MKALQIAAPEDVRLIDIPRPDITEPDQVLVRMLASSICSQHEKKIFKNIYSGAQKCKYPCSPGFPGHEGCGEIEAVGSSVPSLNKGDRVLLCGWAGNLHQEYIVCPERWARPTVSSISPVSLAPTELYACILAILKRGEKILRAKCVVIGLGPAGLAAIQWLKILGAYRITCIEKNKKRLDKAMTLGADAAILSSDAASIKTLKEEEPETVIECSGSHDGIKMAFDLATREALLFGYNDLPFEVNQSQWFEKSLSIKTQFAFDWAVWNETAAHVNRKLIDPGRIVSHVFSFTAGNYKKAMRMLDKQLADKIVMEF